MGWHGRCKVLHDVDGKRMTVDEIAAMLGVTVHALQVRKCNMGGISYQTMVNMYRANMFQSAGDRWDRHMVDGRWITQQEAAQMVRVKVKSIREWRNMHRHKDGSQATLQEAVDYYRQYLTGERKRYKGKPATLYRVRGREITVQQASQMCGSSVNALRQLMSAHGWTLEQAVKHAEELKRRRVEKAILRILQGGDGH